MREFLSVLTRPQTWYVTIPRTEALDYVARWVANYEILEDGPSVTEWLVQLCRDYDVGGRHIDDTNIVATMLAHAERRLLTLNTADFRRYGDLIELLPG